MVPKVDVALPSELFALIVDNISESVIVTDAQIDAPGPHIVYVNAAFEEMTGFSAAEVLGTSPRILQGPDTNREHLDEVRSALQARRRISAQTTNYRKDGTPFELQWSIAPYPQGSEDPQYFVSIQKDVTEELKMKKQSEQLTLLHSVWREVASAGLNLGPLRQRVAEEALRLTNAEAAVVEEPDGSEMIYRAAVGGASGQEGLRLPINRSLSGRCYSSRTTMV
ncbi:MAG: PAS domain-containing protein, partial [Alkalispirochaeta sp.]